jgi:hypothetical protein
MKPNTKAAGRFYEGRMPTAATEPNFSGLGAFAALPSMSVVRIGGLFGALCLGLRLGQRSTTEILTGACGAKR